MIGSIALRRKSEVGARLVLSTVGVVLIGHLGVILDFDRGD